MRLTIDRKAGTPVYQQIVEQIRAQVLTGEMAPGYRLPPERQLAERLGVNRTTVLSAYRELKAEGLVESHVGRGTVVTGPGEGPSGRTAPVSGPVWEHLFSEHANRFDDYRLNGILTLANRRDVISFAAGISSLECRPVEALRNIQRDFLDGGDKKALLVSPVEGFLSLRRAVAGYMERRGCFCRPEEVMMLAGSQQGIDLLARVLLNPGDVVVMEDPTYFPAIQTFRAAGARVMGVPMTSGGMDLDILEQLLQRYRPKLIYTITTFHNPSGVTMNLAGRARLLELACRTRTVLVEDDAYGELCFGGNPLPTLKSMDSAGFVVYLNTFSKTVFPGLRLGWTVADKKLIERFASARQLVDLHPNCLSQQIIERFIVSGGLERHLGEITGHYRSRRDLMLSCLERHAPPGMSWQVPGGGYYVWCRLPEGVSGQELAGRAAEKGVAFLPGELFSVTPGGNEQAIRLNYTFAPREDIQKGVKLLCGAVEELAGGNGENAIPPDLEISPIL